MIKRLRLTRYKAFEQFDASFRSGMNVLVGPNNAGKSTLIAILRLCSILFRNAQRVNPSISIADKGRNVIGHPLASARLRELPGYTDENVHYEFRSEEARVEATSDSGSSLIIVWPADSDPYYYVDIKPGMNARNRGQVTRLPAAPPRSASYQG
jgi:predicted ATP-dependent endonuclease of OLD family